MNAIVANEIERSQSPQERAALRAVVGGRGAAADDKREHPLRQPIDWEALAELDPPPRHWAIEHWFGMGHVTLLSGRGGIGKSYLAQQLGSYLAVGRDLIDKTPQARNVLYWAAEDEPDEIWRRQVHIARELEVSLAFFRGRLIVESFVDRDCTMVEMVYGETMQTSIVEELRSQINDYAADVVILDNIARLFGGNENSRHEVTQFITALNSAARDRRPAIMLLGHIARAANSEFSGSSAWENAVRARLWFNDQLPDQPKDEDAEDATSDLRYLSRRKSNYSAKDLRTLRFVDGVFRCDPYESISNGGLVESLRHRKAERIVRDSFSRLVGLNFAPTDSHTSPAYLPKLIIDHKMADGVPRRDLVDAMHKLVADGDLERVQVGYYANRNPRFGLRLKA